MSWYNEAFNVGRKGQAMYLPTKRNLSTIEKLILSPIPGVNVAALAAGRYTEADDREYIRGYKDGLACRR